jgi:hypothetical protein
VRIRERLEAAWREQPLAVIVTVAVLLRLAAALLSRGFAFHDDHFEVVEVAQRWLDGHRDWLGRTDSLRGLVYPGAHWAVFWLARAVGLEDPQGKMLVVRLLHAAWSMIAVVYGYRIAERLAGREKAKVAGLLLAAFWIAPWGAVHDLIEVACAPPIVLALWLLVRGEGDDGARPRDAFLAGLWMGLAFAIRFQTATIGIGLGLVLLAQRRVRAALALGAGGALAAAVLVGGSDWIGYGRPFSSVLAYVAYNRVPANVARYPNGPWYQYLLTLLGVLIPPTSLLLAWGAVHARRFALLFWPALLFFVVHSAYAGKQERFIFPILPIVLILAAIGAMELARDVPFLRDRPRLVRGLWGWFWIVNTLLLVLYTGNYSKRTRVEPLSFIRAAGDARAVLIETSEPSAAFVPRFYLGDTVPVFTLPAERTVDDLRAELQGSGGVQPNYVVLTGERELDARLARLQPLCPTLEPVRTFRPGVVDWLLHRMNPRHNVNLTARLYRCGTGGA